MNKVKRKRNRLEHYDYSQNGAYFITICTKDKQEILWDESKSDNIDTYNKGVKLSKIGDIVKTGIKQISRNYQGINIEKFVIMPNHIHIILLITSDYNYGKINVPTISKVVQQFKGWVTKETGKSIWQKSFHDHVIRDKQKYLKIWEYIDTNPLKWELDCYHKNNKRRAMLAPTSDK